MIVPGVVITSGRIDVTASAGNVPAYISQGFGFEADNSLCIDTDAPAGAIWNKGFRLSAAGALYGTTTAAADDVWLGGIRVSALGQVVYEAAAAVNAANGDPYTANGRLAVI